LTLEGYRIIIIVITALMMIITEPIPLPAIAIYILVMEVFLGIGSPEEISHSFMNDAVFLLWVH
jgi:sodium-dependent dicarboxylate transporter 2/3/5